MIGAVTCECLIYDVQSLKGKRAVLKSIITRLKQRLNISVSETAYQDLWQRTEISIVTVASNRVVAEKELNKALAMIDSTPEIERTITNFEWF
ncbi:DUF503 domain-containing protein [Anaerobacillus isosaccharinicus]|uniref:DUF503 family protein n=1 Tax=Anaerobacillus isosaccharinicus TaxID=1532552 RepID=A0A1S2M8N9_9BACI|nr:DUF503 family protein [Anaerobacillus isosaccharinicus]MBA5587291.1 DUF503 family protein [Anaerobacillus isosaccharinicus]QOY34517.1 DUF503 family protein [Anaerobacillus isosaccharinicus]